MDVMARIRAEDPPHEEAHRLKWDPEERRFVKWHLACCEPDGRRRGTGWYILMHGMAFTAED
ncbi:MAG: hypothetical protein ACI4NA_01590 [Succinivibrio sp.]